MTSRLDLAVRKSDMSGSVEMRNPEQQRGVKKQFEEIVKEREETKRTGKKEQSSRRGLQLHEEKARNVEKSSNRRNVEK